MGGFGNYALTVRSDKDDHFTEAIVQNAEERENILMASALNGRSRIVGIRLISIQNLAWELMLWSKDSFSGPAAPGTDPDLNTFLGKWLFTAGDGSQVAAAGAYHYYIDGLDIAYGDLSHSWATTEAKKTGVPTGPALHVSLLNRSAVAKIAGLAGAIVAEFLVEPTN